MRFLPLAVLLCGCTFRIPALPDEVADGPGATDLAAADSAPSPDLLPPRFDPGTDGPFRVASLDVTVPISGLFNDTDTTIYGPGDGGTLGVGPFPLVLLSPAVFVSRGEYAAYGKRLASYGLLAVVQTPRNELDTNQYRDSTRKIIDWLSSPTGGDAGKVRGRTDGARIGLFGHGRGGKLALLVAAADSRIKGLFIVDPLDNAEAATARGIIGSLRLGGAPLVLLGETISTGSGITCPQAGEDYSALFPLAPAPALSITFAGAGHHDFVDDKARCGGVCGACKAGTAPPARTHDLSVKYTVAYFLKVLLSEARADAFLTGAEFQKDAQTGAVSQQSK